MIALRAANHFADLRHCQWQRAPRTKRSGSLRTLKHLATTAIRAPVHRVNSSAIGRGWHPDLRGLGAFEVAENNDTANRTRSNHDPTRQIDAAMDLAVGEKRLWVVMEHMTKAVGPRIRTAWSHPLAARDVVQRLCTDHAVLEVTPRGFTMLDIIPGMTRDTSRMRTDARLIWPW
jgi:3-oxoadipate CoA-transferase beta subunit